MDSVMTALREDEKTSTATMKTLQQGVLRTVGGGGEGRYKPLPLEVFNISVTWTAEIVLEWL